MANDDSKSKFVKIAEAIGLILKPLAWLATTGLAIASLLVSIAAYNHASTSFIASITATPASLMKISVPRGASSWDVTVTGSNFNGDSQVWVHYPTDADIKNPSPSGVKKSPLECPQMHLAVSVSSGSFTAKIPISADLPDGTYYIYAIGINTGKEAFFTIQVGPVPQQSPPPAPTSGNTPTGLPSTPAAPVC
jgi:hypothetical protein